MVTEARRLSADDRLAMHEVVSRAAWAYDEARLDVVASCFATDAVMTVEIAGAGAPARIEGRDAIVGLIRSSIEGQNDQRRHVMSSVFLSDDAAGPVVISTLTLVVVAAGTARVLSCGTYRDEMTRDGDAWRIRRRDLRLDLPY